LETKFLVVCNT